MAEGLLQGSGIRGCTRGVTRCTFGSPSSTYGSPASSWQAVCEPSQPSSDPGQALYRRAMARKESAPESLQNWWEGVVSALVAGACLERAGQSSCVLRLGKYDAALADVDTLLPLLATDSADSESNHCDSPQDEVQNPEGTCKLHRARSTSSASHGFWVLAPCSWVQRFVPPSPGPEQQQGRPIPARGASQALLP